MGRSLLSLKEGNTEAGEFCGLWWGFFFRCGLNGIAFLVFDLLILNCDPDDSSDSSKILSICYSSDVSNFEKT